MAADDPLVDWLLRQGDSCLVLGHRLSEWCGHAPVLEEDIALANVALDLIGQARFWLTLAGEVEGAGRDENQLAYLRDAHAYRNVLLIEQKNGDFAVTMTRQFLFDAWHWLVLTELQCSADPRVAEIAMKAVKEVAYHLERSRDWVIRLGDGTDESRSRMIAGLDWMWRFVDEMFAMDDIDEAALKAGAGIDKTALRAAWDERVNAALAEATLERPASRRPVLGGRAGRHSEHLGHLLTHMQFLQRAYPGATW